MGSVPFCVTDLATEHAVSLSAAASHDRLRQALQILAATVDETPARRREVI